MTGISFRGFSWMWIPRVSHQNQCNGRTKFTNERDLQLAKLVYTEVRDDWLPFTARESSQRRLRNEPLLIQSHAFFDPVKRANEGEGCAQGSQQGSSTSYCAWMAVLGQFRQAENTTGSFDETAGYRSWRSPLELCSIWSLRVTNFAQHARRRSDWRVERSVDQKCQKTENNVYRWQCTIIGIYCDALCCEVMEQAASANTNKLKSANSLCHRVKPKHLEADLATGSWTPRVTAEDQSGD